MFSRIKVGAFGAFATLLLALLAATPALAQLSTATVEVVVSDADGGALPGVSVSFDNVDTGFSRQAVTGATGGATLAALPPGTYRAHVELDGFAPVQQDGIVLRVGQTAQLQVTLTLPFRPNPNFGRARATLPGREIQLGLRWVF
jgi:hypothetical protein